MKFALNHDYRFENYKVAFLAGFMQATMIFVVEIVNFFAILTAGSILDVVMNFMALAIIAEFDDFFFKNLIFAEWFARWPQLRQIHSNTWQSRLSLIVGSCSFLRWYRHSCLFYGRSGASSCGSIRLITPVY